MPRRAQRIADIMTPGLIALPPSATLVEAAQLMRDRDVGGVVVEREGRLLGILTDRDIVVRGIAVGRSPDTTPIGDICSQEDLVAVSPGDRVIDAVTMMKQKAIRRLPVVADGRAVGLVSLGDLAAERDRRSALGEISAAPPNH